MFKKRRKLLEGDVDKASDVGPEVSPASCEKNESNCDQTKPPAHRHVERYVGTPISEELRQQFEDFLNSHPDIDEENALTEILRLGLRSADLGESSDPTLAVARAGRLVRLAEKLFLRAKQRCGS